MTGPRVAVASIGSEVTEGSQVDTNAAALSQKLHEVGLSPWVHLALRDDLDELVTGLGWLVDRSDAVICGGGLGPTPDDLTREALASVAGVDLVADRMVEDALIEGFAQRGVRMPASNLRQARMPEGSTPLEAVGTAPGVAMDIGGALVYALPGVPWELEAIFDRDVLPALQERFGTAATVRRIVRVAGISEARVGELVEPVGTDGLDVAWLSGSGEIRVLLTATDPDLEVARARAGAALEEVTSILGPAVSGIDGVSLEESVSVLLRERGETVAFAESATAGEVAARLAGVPGASDVLRGAVVVYATDLKGPLTGMDPQVVTSHGPASVATTEALAVAVRERLGANWGVATTGVLGPGDWEGVAEGTTFWAVASPDGRVRSHSVQMPGDRLTLRRRLGSAALELLRRELTA
ncbi:MAG TPA: CinA family nicotinamide mononucleotide deamidase-related protein [Nitriliruptorales bacterium]